MRVRDGSGGRRRSERWPSRALLVALVAFSTVGITALGSLLHYASRFVAGFERSEAARAGLAPQRILTMELTRAPDGEVRLPTARAGHNRGISARSSTHATLRSRAVNSHRTGSSHKVASHRAKRSPPTFRTVCVRECDGGHFPISFATTPEHFARDAAACKARCARPARLFVYPTEGGSTQSMVDLDGNAYSSLANAGLFLSQHKPDCGCSREQRQQAAVSRHNVLPVGDQAPLIGGIENPQEEVSVDPRFQAPLKPASVIYDATGRAVPQQVRRPSNAAPSVRLLARVPETRDAVAALPAPIGESRPPEVPPPAVEPSVRPTVTGETAAATERTEKLKAKPTKSAEGRSRRAIARLNRKWLREHSKEVVQSRVAARTTVNGVSWFGQRVYTGSDWRLSTYQTLE